MMAKDSVKKRIEGDSGMSFTEFTYQLVQGYDFLWLYENKKCKLQMGGSDQWGNIVTGTELIRRKAGGEAFAFTCPLITKADGTKFGKSEKGNIWLDLEKTTAYDFYQFWIKATDVDAEKWIKIFTFLDEPTVNSLIEDHKRDPGKNILQKKLAEEVTRFVHGENQLQEAMLTTQKTFEQKDIPAEQLTVDDIKALKGVTQLSFARGKLADGIDIVSFLAETGSFPSKGEARKTIQNGGVSINRRRISDVQLRIDNSFLLHNTYILVQKGKSTHFLVEAL
jgi:tyrosyl-tRNA synthetase